MADDPKALLAKFQPREQKPIQPTRQLCLARYSRCGKYLVAGDYQGAIQRWDTSGDVAKAMEPIAGHAGWVQTLAFHSDGKTLFSGDSWGRLCAWPFMEATPKATWNVEKAHTGWIRQVTISPDGKTLASCDNMGSIRLWVPESGKLLTEWEHDQDLLSLAFAPDGKSLLAGDLLGHIHRRELTSGKVTLTYDARELYKLDRIQDVGGVRVLRFSPDGKTLVAGGCEPTTGGFVQGGGVLIYFDAASGKRTQTLKVGNTNTGYILDALWHEAGGFVMAVTSGQPGQGSLIFHRPGDAAPFFNVAKPNCHSVTLAPDARRLAVVATNANSAGNGRNLNAKKEYPGNSSPLYIWDMPKS